VIVPLFLLGLEVTVRGEAGIRQEIEKSVQAQVRYNIRLLESDTAFFDRIGYERRPSVSFIDGTVFLSIAFPPMVIDSTVSPTFVIAMEVETFELQRQLDGFIDYKGGMALLVDQSGRWFATDSGILSQTRGASASSPIESADMDPATVVDAVDEHLAEDPAYSTEYMDLAGEPYVITTGYSSLFDAYLVFAYPERAGLATVRSYRIRLWVFSIATVVSVLLFAGWIRSLVVRPLDKLIGAFRELENGDLSVAIEGSDYEDFAYLYRRFNRTVQELARSIERVYEDELLLKQAELRQLQYQINPHFLYNGFFLLHRMAVSRDLENVVSLSDYLRRYYQYITSGRNELVSLAEELRHLETYVAIQNHRVRDRIRARLPSVDAQLERIRVPRLILQPIVENAYEHGMRDIEDDGLIEVALSVDDDLVLLSIEDNGSISDETLRSLRNTLSTGVRRQARWDTPPETAGAPVPPSAERANAGTALANIHRRLQIRYGNRAGVLLERGALGGLKVTLVIDTAGES
jgi:two-component system sensor histidine kinase YesM